MATKDGGQDTFVGRADDIAFLESLYEWSGPKACAIFGRHRIGFMGMRIPVS